MTEKDKQEIISLLTSRKESARTEVKGVSLMELIMGVVSALLVASIIAGIAMWSDVRELKKYSVPKTDFNGLKRALDLWALDVNHNFYEIQREAENCECMKPLDLESVKSITTRGAVVSINSESIIYGCYIPDSTINNEQIQVNDESLAR